MLERSFPDFGRYQILQILGQGGMGTVYKAYHKILKRSVALKVPHASVLQDDLSRERFLREAQALARLQHPHIVSVYDAGIENGHPYIAMQLVEGHTLSHHIHGASLPDRSRVVAWVIEIAEALDYIHAAGIVHRDLKSSNVLISEEGKALITDFGVVHMDAETTITRGLLGTPAYMSPEQATGRPLDARSDLYSLGIILYEALTGTVPFKNENSLALIQQIIRAQPPSISSLRSDIPPWLVEITHLCIRKQPEHRVQTGAALAMNLREGISSSTHHDLTRSSSWSPDLTRLEGHIRAIGRQAARAWKRLPTREAAANLRSVIQRHATEAWKRLPHIYAAIERFLRQAFIASPSYSMQDRVTGLLKPHPHEIDPIDIVRHPAVIGFVVLWSLAILPNPFGHSRSAEQDGDRPGLEVPADTSGGAPKHPGWQPWPSKP